MTNDLSLEELMKEGTYPEEYAEGKNWKILHGDTLKLVKAFQRESLMQSLPIRRMHPEGQSRMKGTAPPIRNTAV